MEQGIFPVWKRLGETPLEAIGRLRAERPELLRSRMTYAGRLDPAAEGVLLILANEARFRRSEFDSLDKDYEFDVLWGFSTDTFDLLGIPLQSGAVPDDWRARAEDAARRLSGTRSQAYPPYSSKVVRGRPMFEWAREGRLGEIAAPLHEINIASLAVKGHREIPFSELSDRIESLIRAVKGDFRQESIRKGWKLMLSGNSAASACISTFAATVSSGTYVRVLAVEAGSVVGCPALAARIVRTRVGTFKMLC